jgi:dihydropyrimidinase
LTYEGFRLSDPEFLNVLAAVHTAHGIVMVHAENDAIIQYLKKQFRLEYKNAPKFHALSRPPVAEVEAVQRAIDLAQITGTRLYVVHISTGGAARAIEKARENGAQVLGETCPQYLLLTEKELERPGLEGAKFICSPPLRSVEDSMSLWKALGNGNLQTIGTDHCPFFFEGQKNQAGEDYEKIPSGLPGIEARLALIHTFGVLSGRFSLNRWVQLCSTGPAHIFGLYPRKGSLTPGADADIVIFDPSKKVRITQSLFHEQVDYTPYEGFELSGYPVMTISRGKVIVEKGKFVGTRGSGRYLARQVQP